ncbi:cytochrome b561 and DOMON domain-containing protein At5g47530-like [Rutidosis leptorrhynchoides]|uniref:cytochrome b561 and DOMON domain-containing protein At5g47530-like n=1 Tax=Rutidosis leptorrhynchoides TaxID=125765 RepID=UPI003A998703
MAMKISSYLIVLFQFLASLDISSYAETCTDHKFTSKRVYSSCRDLPHLTAHLHWTYNASMGIAQIAYRAKQGSRGWVAWAINPNQIGMVGSEALVAFHNSNGSITVYPTMITSYSPSMLPEDLSFRVSGLSAEFLNNEITIYATVGPFSGGSLVNQVWQAGSLVLDDVPQMHEVAQQNLESTGELDFLSE